MLSVVRIGVTRVLPGVTFGITLLPQVHLRMIEIESQQIWRKRAQQKQNMLTARVRLCGELTRQFKLQKYSNHLRDLYFGRNRSACVLLLKRNRCEGVADKNNMATLETLNFDNLVLRSLPIDSIKENFVRQVPSACFSLVDPTAVKDPEVVAHSESAMCLLDLTQEQVQRTEFAEYFSGNTKLPGSQTAAHCYCGHQFGSFAGQLGDGAAMYVCTIFHMSLH
jgi:hypothetical protein